MVALSKVSPLFGPMLHFVVALALGAQVALAMPSMTMLNSSLGIDYGAVVQWKVDQFKTHSA
jgi:hypothetical protein